LLFCCFFKIYFYLFIFYFSFRFSHFSTSTYFISVSCWRGSSNFH